MPISLRAGVVLLVLASGTLTAQLAVQAGSADSANQAAILSLSQKKYADAEAGFRKVMELEPQTARGAIGLAQALLAERKSDDAIRVLQEELTKNPSRLELYLALGDAAARGGLYDLALNEYQDLLKRLDMRSAADLYLNGPGDNPDPLLQSMNVLAGNRKGPHGLEGVYVRIAESSWHKGDFKAAAEAERKIAEMNPTSSTYLTLGALLEQAGQKPDAEAAYRAAIKLSPDNGPALNNLAYMIAETGGNLDEALQYATRGEKLLPKLSQPLDTVGWVLLKQGNFDSAIGKFSEALRLEPANTSFREHLAKALELKKNGGPDVEALIAVLKSEATPQNQARVRELLGRIGK